MASFQEELSGKIPVFQVEVPSAASLWSTPANLKQAGDISERAIAQVNVKEGAETVSFAESIRTRGWCQLRLRLDEEADATLLREWEEVFTRAFEQDEETKKGGGTYRSEKKLPVGYRKDDEREFFETRIITRESIDGKQVIDPCYDAIEHYEKLVKFTVALQRFVARVVLRDLLLDIGINPESVIDLTDIDERVDESINRGSHGADICDVSSSLLRICSYPAVSSDRQSSGTPTDRSDSMIAFGSHTDTSFLTLGLVSSTPGLELYDRKEMKWLAGEEIAKRHISLPTNRDVAMTVFVGELLQVLTRAHYRATIHRVRAPTHGTRISCPFIIRGKWGRVVNMRNGLDLDCEEGQERPMEDVHLEKSYEHPGGIKALRAHTPDFDGSDISLLHKILDLKRARCRKKNENNDSDWVLAAELEVIQSTSSK